MNQSPDATDRLQKHLERGERLARELAEHLRAMKCSAATIPTVYLGTRFEISIKELPSGPPL